MHAANISNSSLMRTKSISHFMCNIRNSVRGSTDYSNPSSGRFLCRCQVFLLVKFLSSFLKTWPKLDFFSFLCHFFQIRYQVFPEKLDIAIVKLVKFYQSWPTWHITTTWYNDYINNSSVSVRENSQLIFRLDNFLLFVTWSWTFWCIYHVLIFPKSKFKIVDILMNSRAYTFGLKLPS